jgi:hypothetical protein
MIKYPPGSIILSIVFGLPSWSLFIGSNDGVLTATIRLFLATYIYSLVTRRYYASRSPNNMAIMQHVSFGSTGGEVSRLGFGCDPHSAFFEYSLNSKVYRIASRRILAAP